MIKQDFIVTTLEGSRAYILTEFEFIVKSLVEKGYNITSIENAFNRGIELGKKNTNYTTNKDLLEALGKSLKELIDEIEED